MKQIKSQLTDKQDFENQLLFLKTQFIHYLKNKKYSSNTILRLPSLIQKHFFSYLIDDSNISDISELTRIHIMEFHHYLFSRIKKDDSTWSKIKLFCKFLQDEHRIEHNPFMGLDFKNHSEKKEKLLWENIQVPSRQIEFKSFLSKLKVDFIKYLVVSGLAQLTIQLYDRQLDYFFYFLLNSTEISSIQDMKKDTIRLYQTYLSTKSDINEELLSLTTQRRRLNVVKKFCSFLVEYDYMENNISSSLRLPKTNKSLPKGILTLSQISKILSSTDLKTPVGIRDRAILEVLYSTGIRNIELRNLKLKDIDCIRSELWIEKGKGGKRRIVPTGEVCSTFIEDYLKKARPFLIRFNPSTQYLFVSYRGKKLTTEMLNTIVKKYVAKSGIKQRITPHSFRHTCATHMLKGNASLRHIQLMLGHSSINSTQIYTRVEISDLRKVHSRCHPRGKKQV